MEATTSLELESKIQSWIFKENKRTTHFTYGTGTDPKNPVQLLVTTLNTENGESFVLRVVEGTTKEECLKQVIHYLEVVKPSQSPFTVEWKRKGEGTKREQSYFYCNDALEVCENFYHGKRRDEYIVYSIEMRPIS